MADNCAINLETGVSVCAAPPNCGYVNGQYTCDGQASNTGSGSSAATGNLPQAEAPDLRFSSEEDSWPFAELLSQFAEWLVNVLLWIPRKVFEAIVDGLIAVAQALPPVPALEAWNSAAPALAGLAYFAHVVALKEGVSIIIGTLIVRFLLRRIPFIG